MVKHPVSHNASEGCTTRLARNGTPHQTWPDQITPSRLIRMKRSGMRPPPNNICKNGSQGRHMQPSPDSPQDVSCGSATTTLAP